MTISLAGGRGPGDGAGSASVALPPSAGLGPQPVRGPRPATPLSRAFQASTALCAAAWPWHVNVRPAGCILRRPAGERPPRTAPEPWFPSPRPEEVLRRRGCGPAGKHPHAAAERGPRAGAAGPGKHARPGRRSSASRRPAQPEPAVPTRSDPSAAGLCPCPAGSKAASALCTTVVSPQGSAPRSW